MNLKLEKLTRVPNMLYCEAAILGITTVNMKFKKFQLNFLYCVFIVSMPRTVFPEINYSLENSNASEKSLTEKNSTSPDFGFVQVNEKNGMIRVSDSLAEKELYTLWKSTIHSCRILLPVAAARGYGAASGEVAERLSCCSRVFPRLEIDSNLVEEEIIIEKYLLQDLGITPSEQQIETNNRSFSDTYPFQQISTGDVSQILARRKIFTMNTVTQLCRELEQRQQQKDVVRLVTVMKPWEYSAIALNTDPQQCLVNDPGNRVCLLSVKDFNDYIYVNRMARGLRLDIARVTALRELLKDLYDSNKAEEAGLTANKSLVKELEQLVESRLINIQEPMESDSSIDEKFLQYTYEKYYDRYFGEKNIKTVNIIGSTDSLYIDSLFHLLKKAESDVNHSKKRSIINSFPWTTISSAELPDIITLAIDTLRLQQSTSFKTSFGFFLCRMVSVQHRKGISFEDARQKLEYISYTEHAESQGKPDSVRAWEYYRDHLKEFMTPDTLLSLSWLVPLNDRMFYQNLDQNRKIQMITDDTTAFRPVLIRSENLPSDIGDSLLRYSAGIGDNNQLIGPIKSRFGTWYFSVKNIICGGKQLPFTSVRKKIINEFSLVSFPFDSIIRTGSGDTMIKRTVLAGAYQRYLSKQMEKTTREISEAEIAKLIENKTIRLPFEKKGPSDLLSLKLARNILKEDMLIKSRTDANKWIESLDVDYELLFSGCPGQFQK